VDCTHTHTHHAPHKHTTTTTASTHSSSSEKVHSFITSFTVLLPLLTPLNEKNSKITKKGEKKTHESTSEATRVRPSDAKYLSEEASPQRSFVLFFFTQEGAITLSTSHFFFFNLCVWVCMCVCVRASRVFCRTAYECLPSSSRFRRFCTFFVLCGCCRSLFYSYSVPLFRQHSSIWRSSAPPREGKDKGEVRCIPSRSAVSLLGG
jgi:hypothetical protein